MTAILSESASLTGQLVVRVGTKRLSVPAHRVREVARLSNVTPVPMAPRALLGLTGLRSETLAVLSTHVGGDESPKRLRQMLVLEGADRVAFAIDAVDRIDRDGATIADNTIEELPIDARIAEAFPVRGKMQRGALRARKPGANLARSRSAFLRFTLGGQSFALPLAQVAEVIAIPETIALLPGADAAVVGTAQWRDRSIGILAARVLLGMGSLEPPRSSKPRVVVVAVGEQRLGLLVDEVKGSLFVEDDRIDPVPLALQRSEAEARITAICRLPDGGGLVSVLAAEHLASEARTRQLLHSAADDGKIEHEERDRISLLPVRLGAHRLAFPLSALDSIAARPRSVTHLPGAPAWLVGLALVSGAAVPLVDLTLKLTGNPAQGLRQRLLMVRSDDQRLGLLVEETGSIVHVASDILAPAPLPSTLAGGIFGEVLELGGDAGITLVLDPAAVLSSAEADLIAHTAQAGSVSAA